jgi:hypothetical protein
VSVAFPAKGERWSIGVGRLEIGVDSCNLADRCMTIGCPPVVSGTHILPSVSMSMVTDYLPRRGSMCFVTIPRTHSQERPQDQPQPIPSDRRRPPRPSLRRSQRPRSDLHQPLVEARSWYQGSSEPGGLAQDQGDPVEGRYLDHQPG